MNPLAEIVLEPGSLRTTSGVVKLVVKLVAKLVVEPGSLSTTSGVACVLLRFS